MMFGKGLAIRDRFANFRMDYLDMSHLDVDEVELVLPVPSTKSSGAGVSEGASNGVSDTAPANAPVKLNKTQSAIIKVLLKDNRATYEDLTRTIGVDRTTIRRNIAVLKDKGAIRRVGEDKDGHCEVLIAIENVV